MVSFVMGAGLLLVLAWYHLIVSGYKIYKRYRLMFAIKRKYHIIYSDPYYGMRETFYWYLVGIVVAPLVFGSEILWALTVVILAMNLVLLEFAYGMVPQGCEVIKD